MSQIILHVTLSDGKTYTLVTPPTLPNPVPFPGGWVVEAYDGQRPARARHDKVSRTFVNKSGLMQTNETIVLTGAPDFRSKIITPLDTNWSWVIKFISGMGWFLWGLYVQPGAGFQDTNEDPTDPMVGPFKQQSLGCGGNLHNTFGEVIWTSQGAYVQIEHQSFYEPPIPYAWEDRPHLFTKQVLVGHNANKETYYIVHQKNGDHWWPLVSKRQLAIAMKDIEYLPELPFRTRLNGVDVVIDAYCFKGSNTYGRINGLWYLLEEMVVSGLGSCRYDRRVYVENWIETCPPPVKGWSRTEATLMEIVVWMLTGRSRLARYILTGREQKN